MTKFKPGERVRCYNGTLIQDGVILAVRDGDVYVDTGLESTCGLYHPKQLRRLKPKVRKNSRPKADSANDTAYVCMDCSRRDQRCPHKPSTLPARKPREFWLCVVKDGTVIDCADSRAAVLEQKLWSEELIHVREVLDDKGENK